jgi:plasmid replication initiation protein
MQIKETIIQHNSISNAKHDLSATQMDILFTLISKINNDDPEDKVYAITVRELEEYTRTPINYQRLREATKELGSKTFEQVYNDGSYDQIWIFSRVKYERGKGLLLIRFSPDIKPYLFDLKRNFTILNLRHILRMRSKFSKRLYQIVCSKRNLGTFTISLDVLKERLGVADQYQKFSAFRKYVLDVAKEEVADADVSFDYNICKQGRRVTDIEFTVITNREYLRKSAHTVPEEAILLPSGKSEPSPNSGSLVHPEQHLHPDKADLYQRCKAYGLSDAQIRKIFEQMKFSDITRTLYQINLAFSDGFVKNRNAYAASQFACLRDVVST